MKEEKSQVKAGVGIEAPWRTFAKEMSFAFPKMASKIVRSVEVLEEDGGLGTVYLINLGSDKSQFQFYIFSGIFSPILFLFCCGGTFLLLAYQLTILMLQFPINAL